MTDPIPTTTTATTTAPEASLAADESSLRQLGQQMDAGATDAGVSIGDQVPEAEQKPEASEPEARVTDPAAEPPVTKELSAYEKERTRLSKSWQELNAEKERIKAEKAEIERLRAAPAEQQQQRQDAAATETYRDEKGFSAEEFDDLAKEATADGDTELAKQASDRAAAIRAKGAEVQQQKLQAAQAARVQEVEGSMRQQILEAVKADPELKTPEMKTAINGLFEKHPVLSVMPDGFKLAVQIAKSTKATAALTALQGKHDALAAENARLTKLTSLSGSGPAKQGGGGGEVTEADIRRLAADHDNGSMA